MATVSNLGAWGPKSGGRREARVPYAWKETILPPNTLIQLYLGESEEVHNPCCVPSYAN